MLSTPCWCCVSLRVKLISHERWAQSGGEGWAQGTLRPRVMVERAILMKDLFSKRSPRRTDAPAYMRMAEINCVRAHPRVCGGGARYVCASMLPSRRGAGEQKKKKKTTAHFEPSIHQRKEHVRQCAPDRNRWKTSSRCSRRPCCPTCSRTYTVYGAQNE